MKAVFERKYFEHKTLDVDTTTKSVKIAIAELESIDRDNDVFSPTAFDKTIKERGPQGTNEIWHMIDHGWGLTSALGKFKELYREGKYVVGVSNYKQDHALWRDTVWPFYRDGDINQHSVGFGTIKSEKGDMHRVITEAFLWEGSAVLWGANPYTPTLSVTKSTTKEEQAKAYTKHLDQLIKHVQAGRFTEDSSLLVIQLKQIEQILIDLSQGSTEPVAPITQPDSAMGLIEVKNTIRELLMTA